MFNVPRRALLLSACLLLLATGCFSTETVRPGRWLDRLGWNSELRGPDMVALEYAIIERSQGDPDLNVEIWKKADEQLLPYETQMLLEENGLRVGLLSGVVPAAFQKMLDNPGTITGRRNRFMQIAHSATIPLSHQPVKAEYQLRNKAGNPGTMLRLEKGIFSWNVTPSFAEEGKVRLHLFPEVQDLERKLWLPPGAISSVWNERSDERYTALTWDVNLYPGDYLLIGTTSVRKNTLGSAAFLLEPGDTPKQRLVMFRARRNDAPERALPETPPGRANAPLPLAYQAGAGKSPSRP
jgi:hypothetical protein